MNTSRFSISIAILLAIVACSCIVAPASGLTQYNGYFLQGQEIVNYDGASVTLANGTTIMLDAANITRYLHQITQSSGNPMLLSYSNSNYVVPFNTSENYPEWDPKNATRIRQGDCVSLGDTIDIAGVGWYTGYLSYYGLYYDGYSDDYEINRVALLKVDARNLTKFYVEPAYFQQYPGWWYTNYYEDNSTTRSNDRMFYVGSSCGFIKNTSVDNVARFNISDLYSIKERSLSQLPEKKITGIDFIISKNLTSKIESPIDTRVWVFGRSDYLYDIDNPINATIFYSNITRDWESGRYDLVYISRDGNGLFDERYNQETESITSPFVDTPTEYIGNLQPRIVHDKLLSLVNSSYQKQVTEYHVEVQDPRIDVAKLDQWQGWDNATMITIAGYTNANPGDGIHIQMDKNTMGRKESAKRTWTTYAWGNMSAYRFWNITFMIDIQGENPGQHNMTITSDSGGSMIAPFYIYREKAAHYIPENYIQYVNNSPFIPPVIQTVTIPVPGPTQYVYVTVTPSQESVDAAQQKALDNTIIEIIKWIVIVIVGFFGIRFLYRAWRRSKWMNK